MNTSSKALHFPSIETIADAPMEPDAFLAWTATLGREYEGYKVELSNGRVTKMMVNVSRAHAQVCTNIMRILFSKLGIGLFTITVADFGVKTPFGVRSPDVLVEPAGGDAKGRASENPIFIAEVLSPSTMAIDFLEKLPEYIAIPSLQAYLICSQDEPFVWLMARGENGDWPSLPQEIAGRDASVPIKGLDLDMPIAEIYRGIPSPI